MNAVIFYLLRSVEYNRYTKATGQFYEKLEVALI